MSNRKMQINFRVSEDEYEQIRKNARFADKAVSAYIRETAMNMCVVKVNHDCVTEHKKQISGIKNAIYHLVFTIRSTKKYTPPDLEYIFNKLDLLTKYEKEFLNAFLDSLDNNKTLIARTVRSIVNKKLKK